MSPVYDRYVGVFTVVKYEGEGENVLRIRYYVHMPKG